jgi:hypothetical protein
MSNFQFSFNPTSEDSEIIAQISKNSKQNKGKLIYLNDKPIENDEFTELKEEFFH